MPNELAFPSLRKEDVRGIIAELAASGNTQDVVFVTHADERTLQRDILSRQVFQVLRLGEVHTGPDWDVYTSESGLKSIGWLCVLKRLTAGRMVRVVCKLVDEGGTTGPCLIITAYAEGE